MSNQVRALLANNSQGDLVTPITWLDSSAANAFTLSGSQILEFKSVYGGTGNFISDSATRPVVVNNALNGFPVLSSNAGAGFVYNNTIIKTLTSQAVYLIISFANAPNNARVFGQGIAGSSETASGNYLPLYRSNSGSLASYFTNVLSGIGFSTNQWSLFQSIHYGNAVQNAVNGVYGLKTTVASNLSVTPNIYALGASHLKNLIANASFSQLVVLDFAPSESLDSQIQGFLMHKCGLASSLPAAHVWKNQQPSNPFVSP